MVIKIFTEHLLCVRYCSKHFVSIHLKILYLGSGFFFVCLFFVFFSFLGPLLRHMELPRLGV